MVEKIVIICLLVFITMRNDLVAGVSGVNSRIFEDNDGTIWYIIHTAYMKPILIPHCPIRFFPNCVLHDHDGVRNALQANSRFFKDNIDDVLILTWITHIICSLYVIIIE